LPSRVPPAGCSRTPLSSWAIRSAGRKLDLALKHLFEELNFPLRRPQVDLCVAAGFHEDPHAAVGHASPHLLDVLLMRTV
jgi:hypothetical protein